MSDPMKEALDAVGAALDHARKVRREVGRPRCGRRITVRYHGTAYSDSAYTCARFADHAGPHVVPDGKAIDGRPLSIEWEQG